ncbi:MAG TPA: hypothetical protein VI423_10890 [Paenisporosarcina sp.]|nr:hypothetical protein [Paenisporosarcina sp.]
MQFKVQGDVVSVCELLVKIDPEAKLPWFCSDEFMCGESPYSAAKKMRESGDYGDYEPRCGGSITMEDGRIVRVDVNDTINVQRQGE